MYAIGIMSGTSLDGIDVALCHIEGSYLNTKVELLAFMTYPFPHELYDKMLTIMSEQSVELKTLTSLNFELGNLFADACLTLCRQFNFPIEKLDYIASHGQTIYHLPEVEEPLVSSTLQLGESSIIAEKLKCQVISNFREMDMAVGGQGAPLVPYSEFLLYYNPSKRIGLLNLGGIANVTILNKAKTLDEVIAFDTGPANILINEAMNRLYNRTYDKDGDIASSGDIIESLANELKLHPYIFLDIPKSTGRELFNGKFVDQILSKYSHNKSEDIIATLTWFTAYCVAVQVDVALDQLIVGGGGAHNKTILKWLTILMPNTQVLTQNALGYSNDAKEAIAFVILGNETLQHRANNVPSATGAKQPVILGKITPW